MVIGLQRSSVELPWVWAGGEPVTFLPFKSDEPKDDDDRLYVFMEKTGGWKTKKPSDKARFICQIPF